MSKSQQIKKQLMEVLSIYAVGDKIPARTTLCRQLGTNRVVLDQAILAMVGEGYLASRKGSGTYIARNPHSLRNWGVIVPDVSDPIYAGLVRGVENVAREHAYNVILCNSDFDIHQQQEYLGRLTQSKVEGLILVPVLHTDIKENLKVFQQLEELRVPYVFCNRTIDGIHAPAVVSNDFHGGYLATRHLLAQGYRRIAYVAPVVYKGSIDRCLGYITALEEAGHVVDRSLIVMDEPNDTPGVAGRLATMIKDTEVDAFFCFNDRLAAKILEVAHVVGRPIGVVGYNDSPLCESNVPKITSVKYRNVEIGEDAAGLLVRLLAGEQLGDFRIFMHQPELIVRESSAQKNV